MLQGRLLSYPDAQRYRLGANYEQIQSIDVRLPPIIIKETDK